MGIKYAWLLHLEEKEQESLAICPQIESSEKAFEPRVPRGTDVRKTAEAEQHQALGTASPKNQITQGPSQDGPPVFFFQILSSSC